MKEIIITVVLIGSTVYGLWEAWRDHRFSRM